LERRYRNASGDGVGIVSKPYVSTRSLAVAYERFNNEWMAQAACLTVNPEIFYPVPRDEANSREMFEAIAVCVSCPVRAECLDFAYKNNERFGIWGGLTPNARTRLKNQHRKKRAA
jgi:WhiB family redox-sensing transcriptional regulator